MSKIKELEQYVIKVRAQLTTSQGAKKEFFERELRKVMTKIQELSK